MAVHHWKRYDCGKSLITLVLISSKQSGVQEAILTLNYAAIILSISATTTALSLTDEFGEIPSRASRNPLHTSAHPAVSFQGENWGILRYFGVRKSTRWFIYHCKSTMHDSIFF